MENPSDKEQEVALILQFLPELFLQSLQCRRSRSHLPRWATKKRRSRRVHRAKKLLSPTSERLHSPLPPFSLTGCHDAYLPLSADIGKLKRPAPTSSPASPLHFYPSGDDTGNNPAVTAAVEFSPSTRPAKKIKLKNKELMNGHIKLARRLSETNKLLKQEKADYAKHHEALLEENSRLKMMLSKSKLTVGKTERDHPHLLQPCSREHRTFPSSLGRSRPTVSQCPDILLPPLEPEEARTKTTAGLSPPPQTPTPMQSSVEEKPLFCLAPVRFWGLSGGCVRFINPIAQVAPDRMGSPDTEMAVAERSQPCYAKRKATADARKRRMEMNRMKSACAAATGASFGNAAKVR